MCRASKREPMAYSSLLRQLDTVHANPEAMPARLIRSRLAEACVPSACATALDSISTAVDACSGGQAISEGHGETLSRVPCELASAWGQPGPSLRASAAICPRCSRVASPVPCKLTELTALDCISTAVDACNCGHAISEGHGEYCRVPGELASA